MSTSAGPRNLSVETEDVHEAVPGHRGYLIFYLIYDEERNPVVWSVVFLPGRRRGTEPRANETADAWGAAPLGDAPIAVS